MQGMQMDDSRILLEWSSNLKCPMISVIISRPVHSSHWLLYEIPLHIDEKSVAPEDLNIRRLPDEVWLVGKDD